MFRLQRLALRRQYCLSSGAQFPNHAPTTNRLTDRFNRHIIDLNSNPVNQIQNSDLIDAIRRLPSSTPANSQSLIQLDQQSCNRIQHMSHDDLLDVLQTWANILPHQFHRLSTYALAIERLCATYRSSQPPSDFLTICHLLGAGKKRGQSPALLDAFIRRHLNKYAHGMSAIELAIVATAAFRTAIRLQPNHGQLFERAVVQMDAADGLDVALLVAFVKTLRLARIRSESVRRQLGDWMRTGRFDRCPVEFRGLAHLFAFYASNRFGDEPAVEWLGDRAMRSIRDDYPAFRGLRKPIDMRAKDFAMVLWSWAQLGVQPPGTDDLRLVCTILKEKLTVGEYDRDFDGLVDATLSLWQCGLRSRVLVNAVLCAANRRLAVPAAAASRVKLDSRRRLLQTCVEVERPDWLDGTTKLCGPSCIHAIDPWRPAKDYLLAKTPNLLHVRELVRSKFTDVSATLVQPVRDLNIPGLLVDGRPGGLPVLMMEVAEEHTTLSDGCTPFGLLALKMRLLRAHSHRVLLVNPSRQTDLEIVAAIVRDDAINSKH